MEGRSGGTTWAHSGEARAAGPPRLAARRERAQPPLINIRSRSPLRTTFMVPFNETVLNIL